MRVAESKRDARAALLAARRRGLSTGLVPTMGALHEGHLSLMRRAVSDCEFVAATIFVNPTQFAPGEDFDAYPRTRESDLEACRGVGVHLVFCPSVEEMYAADDRTRVIVSGLTAGLCGAHRPGHFDGVTTVVCKLFHILPTDRAYFGEKDYQQVVVIRKMASDLDFPIEIVLCPTVREADGLAMSSRNVYLDGPQRQQAASIYAALRWARDEIAAGAGDAAALSDGVRRRLAAAGPCHVDYIEVVDPETLTTVTDIMDHVRICVAVRIGNVRLIDNIAAAPP
ncbi:MAG: pantoate--beta-alanine ligase [Phycisphaerales bacterium]|nr:MAG: pantoate--beta-alanine ligase [Phycisphaerales bacterium]